MTLKNNWKKEVIKTFKIIQIVLKFLTLLLLSCIFLIINHTYINYKKIKIGKKNICYTFKLFLKQI